MKINVPEWAEKHFWDEPPDGAHEFWAFRFKPKCKVGDPIEFFIRGERVAQATVSRIEPPGQSACDGTGRFKNRWKVFWKPESFVEFTRPVLA